MDPDPAGFRLNNDPDPIQIQGFHDQKCKKIIDEFFFFDQKTTIYLSLGLHKGFPTYTGVYILENKYGLMGKKYHENNARADKKGEKERKDMGKEKISDKMTEQEQCFIKLWETWKKKFKKCRQ
jgi:hypothetical protein